MAADFWTQFNLSYGLPTAILSAIGGALALSEHNVIGGFIALVVSGLSAVLTFINPSEKSTSHLNAGNNYDALLSKARIFRAVDCWNEASEKVLTEKLKDLVEERNKLNRSCPLVPEWAYKKAKKGIKAGETSYEVDKENSDRPVEVNIE